MINGIDDGDSSGNSVSTAGDVNDDGFDDLIIGAPGANYTNLDGQNAFGQSYVIFGRDFTGQGIFRVEAPRWLKEESSRPFG